MLTPEIAPFPYHLQPEDVFPCLPTQGALYLDSALKDGQRGRYSFIACDPFAYIVCNTQDRRSPFERLREMLSKYTLDTVQGLPPFQGGVAGFWGYELNRFMEKLPEPKQNDLDFPDAVLGVYDVVLAWDHALKNAVIFASGFPERDTQSRKHRANKRIQWMQSLLASCQPYVPGKMALFDDGVSTFSQKNYEAACRLAQEYIRAGDIFEVNLSQRFSHAVPVAFSPYDLYYRLRQVNAAPFAGFFSYGEHTLLSASPERFIRLEDKLVETRPIKGTRARHPDPALDEKAAADLLHSEKDHAENVMIVDLMRNDLSRVCLPGSVQVPQLCALESFRYVHHLVSCVQGRLIPSKNAVDLLEATFPGGSITGAPKIRAMEIIAEIEPTVRGPYCGSLGYIGFNGAMDTSILIRTFCMNQQQISYQVGGAITIDSDPEEEYFETMSKARGLRLALGLEA